MGKYRSQSLCADKTLRANTVSPQVYAEVVAGLSALTTLLYCIPFILRFAFVWAWNLILFILWIVLFGIFGGVGLLWSEAEPLVAGRKLTVDCSCSSTKTPMATATFNA